jgi:hypothetical protein
MPPNSAHCKPIDSSQRPQIQGQLFYGHCEPLNSGNMFTGGIQLLQLDIFMKHYKELMTTRSTIQQQPLKNVQNSMCLTLALSLSLS